MRKFILLKKIFVLSLFVLLAITASSQTTVFNENFEGATHQMTAGGVPAWTINTSLSVSGSKSIHNEVANLDSSFLVTPTMDLSLYTFVVLDFQHICKIEFFDSAEIYASIDNGATWQKLPASTYLGSGQYGTQGNRFNANSYGTVWLPGNAFAVPDNTWWRNEKFNVSSIVGNQSQVKFMFKLVDGASSPGPNGNAGWYLDDIKVTAQQYLHDLVLKNILSPVEEMCYSGNEIVSIIVKNIGLNAVNLPFTASYKLGNMAVVNETVNIPIGVNDSITYTFNTPINFILSGTDSTMMLNTFVNMASDPFQNNDSLSREINFKYIPPAPIGVNDTVPYGTFATLGANSPYRLNWYASPTSTDRLDTGAVFTTPILYGNTSYWVSSISGTGGNFMITEICHYKAAPGVPVGGWPSYLIADDYIEISGEPGGDLSGYKLEIWTASALEGSQTLGANTILSPNGTCIIAIGQLGSSVPSPANFYYHSGHTATQGSSTSKGYILKKPNGDIVDAVIYGSISFPAISGVTAADWTGTTPAVSGSGVRLNGPYTKTSANWAAATATIPQNPNAINQGVEVPVTGCESPRVEVKAVVTGNPAVDAGVISINSPLSPTNLAPQNLNVTIQNFGTSPLTTATINWTQNGVLKTPFSWTGNLALSEKDSVNIALMNPVMGNNYIVAWTSNPNGLTDPMLLNDTAHYIFEAFEPLCGTYTVGGVGSNFATIADAISALEYNDMTCPVIFNINPGIYNERVVVNPILGSSITNTITFKGTQGTIIEFSPTITGERAVVYVDGAENIIFDSLEIRVPQAAAFGWGVYIGNNSENITVKNSKIQVPTASTATNYAGIIVSGSATAATTAGINIKDITIENNNIISGYYGLSLVGSTTSKLSGAKVSGNKFEDTYYYGVYANNTSQPEITNNSFNNRVTGGTTAGAAIYNLNADGPFDFSNNSIINAGQYGIYVSGSNSTPGDPSKIVNNSIGAGFRNTGTTCNGIYLTTSSVIDVHYNSINMNGNTGRGINALATATGLSVLNNSFVFIGSGAGYAAYFAASASLVENNHNNYFSVSSNFVFYGAAVADLVALQAVNIPAGNDANSVSGNPVYTNDSTLLPLGTILNNVGTPIAGITTDILGTLRDASTPDIGAFEFSPLSADIALEEARLSSELCLSANDSLYVTINNIIGSTVDFAIDPLTVVWNVTGPINSNGSFIINTGTLAPSTTLEIGKDGIDMSLPGNYILSVLIQPNAVNSLGINDTINNAHTLTVQDNIFFVQPDSVYIVSPNATVDINATSNMFPGGNFYISEVCHYRGATTGAPVGGWPSYLIADDYIEVTGSPNSNLSGYTLEIWTASALEAAQVLGAGTILSPNGTAIIATGQLGSSVPSPANFYYHSGHTATQGSTTAKGYILKTPNGDIMDAVVYGNLVFPAASGVTPAHWTGTTSATSSAGNRLIGPYTKSSANWVVSSSTAPQDPNIVNPGTALPPPGIITGFTWSLDGVVLSHNNPDTTVGPWATNALYNYVATYTNACGTFTDTVKIEVFVPTWDLALDEILEPQDEDCYSGANVVSVKINNLGLDTIFGGFTASYKLGNYPTVTENVNLTIFSGQSEIYTFNTPINFMSFLSPDTTLLLETWVTHPLDQLTFNDNKSDSFKFVLIPPDPIVVNDTVNYGLTATLVASSLTEINWFTDINAQIPIHQGDTLITPQLYNTTVYYAQAVNSTIESIGLPQSSLNASSGSGTTNVGLVFDVISPTLLKSVTVFPVSASNIAGTVTIEVINSAGVVLHTRTTNVVGSPAATPVPHVIDLDFMLQPGTNLKLRQFFTGISGLLFEPSASAPAGNYGYPFVIPGVVSINTSTLTAHPTNTPRNDLYYYFYDLRFGSVGCSSNRIPVEAFVIQPSVEPELVSILLPNENQCSNNSDSVKIRITNNGAIPIVDNFTASYSLNSNTPITQAITTALAPGDTLDFTFSVPIQLNLTSGDSTFNLEVTLYHPQDFYLANNTLTKNVKLSYIPPAPTPIHATINYGTSAQLEVTSNSAVVNWYDSPTSNTVIETGLIFNTPVLYGTTSYYAQASTNTLEVTGLPQALPTATSGAGTTNFGLVFDVLAPTTLKAVTVYPVHASGASGTVTIEVINSSGTVLHSKTANVVGSPSNIHLPHEIILDFNLQPGTNLKLRHARTGITGLLFEPAAAAPSGNYGYPFEIPGVISFNTSTLTAHPTNTPNNSLYYYFYNIKVGVDGCESPRTEVIATVSAIPVVDAGVLSIDSPTSPTNFQPQPVNVTIRNYGSDPLTTATINWSINGVLQTPYSWAGSLPSGDIMSNINLGNGLFSLGNNTIQAWTSMPNGVLDPTPVNDTATLVIQAFEPLCGTFYIGGPNANFNNFAEAIYALENYSITCPVTFIVEPGTYSETVVFTNINGSSAINTITFKPAPGGDVILTSASTNATLRFNAAKNIIFDGSNSGTNSRNMIIENTSIATNTASIWVSSQGTNLGSENITLKNLKVRAGTNTVTSSFGIVSSGTTITTTATGAHNNNLKIENNLIERAYFGVYARGVASTGLLTGLEIKNNTIGSNVPSDYVLFRGVDIQNATAPLIEGNNIFNMRITTTVTIAGIDLGANVTKAKVSKNRITGSRSTTGGAYGINISTTTTDSITIVNNMISDLITANNAHGVASNAFGIRITGGANHKVYYNSVNLHGTVTGGTGAGMSAAFIVTATTPTGLDVRNNIFANSAEFAAATGRAYAIYSPSAAVFAVINYNNYYSSGPNAMLGYLVTQKVDLTEWKLASGKDVNSISVNPLFVAPNDLRTFAFDLDGTAIPIASVTDDFFGSLRNSVTPDVGAVEFTPSTIDAGVIAVNAPTGIYSEGDNEPVMVTVRNFGLDPITTLPVKYIHNNNPEVTFTWTGNLLAGQTAMVTLPNLSVEPGLNNVCAIVNLHLDTLTYNDTLCATFYGMPGLILFHDDFEGSTSFTTDDTVWQHGVPAGVKINTAASGTQAWVTNLTGNYPDIANTNLVSPLFSFTGITGAYLSLSYYMDGEINNDGGLIQYSTDNGINWVNLGVINDPDGFNWYDSFVGATPAWSHPTNAWRGAFMSLSQLDNAGSGVRFRVNFRSNASINAEGMGVDNVKIHVPFIATDAGVTEIIAPSGVSATGSPNQVTVKIRNNGTQTLTSIPVSFRPGTQPAINGTWTGTLLPGDETTYTFTSAFIGPNNPFTLCAYTSLSGDVYRFNDSACVVLIPGLPTIDAGVTEIIAPVGEQTPGQAVTVTVKVKNFGSQTLSSIPVQFALNGTTQATEMITTPLLSGDSTTYSFVTKLTVPNTDFQLCAKTAVPSDAIAANDQTCKNFTVGVYESEQNGLILMQNIPNPATESTVIGFSLPSSGKVYFRVTSVLGEVLYQESKNYDQGFNSIEIDTRNLAAGIYYYSIIFENTTLTRKMSKQ